MLLGSLLLELLFDGVHFLALTLVHINLRLFYIVLHLLPNLRKVDATCVSLVIHRFSLLVEQLLHVALIVFLFQLFKLSGLGGCLVNLLGGSLVFQLQHPHPVSEQVHIVFDPSKNGHSKSN